MIHRCGSDMHVNIKKGGRSVFWWGTVLFNLSCLICLCLKKSR